MEQNAIILQAMVKYLIVNEIYSYAIKAYFGFAFLYIRYDDIVKKYYYNWNSETKSVDVRFEGEIATIIWLKNNNSNDLN